MALARPGVSRGAERFLQTCCGEDEWSARLSRPTLNCWAYDVRENIKLRNFEMRAEAILEKPPCVLERY